MTADFAVSTDTSCRVKSFHTAQSSLNWCQRQWWECCCYCHCSARKTVHRCYFRTILNCRTSLLNCLSWAFGTDSVKGNFAVESPIELKAGSLRPMTADLKLRSGIRHSVGPHRGAAEMGQCNLRSCSLRPCQTQDRFEGLKCISRSASLQRHLARNRQISNRRSHAGEYRTNLGGESICR